MYVRVEGFTFNKVTAQLSFQITYWIDRESAIKHNRVYLDETVKGMVGLVQNKVIYFDTDESEGKELVLAQFHKVLVYFLDLLDPVYKPNHAAPAPTTILTRPLCSKLGAGRSINHITTLYNNTI